MTENKRYTAQVMLSMESVRRSNDMVLVKAEQNLLVELYTEADMPRDFRIQFRHEPMKEQDSIRVVARLTVIDPTNPAVEEEKDWFRWVKQAPVRDDGAYTKTGTNTALNSMINSIYAPKIEEQLVRAAELHPRDLQTFDALSGLGAIKSQVAKELDRKLLESLKVSLTTKIQTDSVGGVTEA
jgi:hypothetical protein